VPKNIVHFAPAYTSVGGGIFEVVENLSIAQTKESSENIVAIVCPREFKGQKRKYIDARREISAILPYKLSAIFREILSYPKLIRLTQGADVLHIHGAWSLQFLLIVPILLLSRNLKVIFQPHGLLSPEGVKRRANFKKKVAWFLYQKLIVFYSDVVLACSNAEARELVSNYNCSSKVDVLPNGLDPAFLAPLETTARIDKLLFLSQIIPVKGIEPLLDAIASLAKIGVTVPLDIYGYGPAKYVEKIQTKIDSQNLQQQVHLKGKVNREDRVSVFDQYRYFILPSYHENFGICVLEALSRGCLPIVSINTPWSEPRFAGLVETVQPCSESIRSTLREIFERKSYGPKEVHEMQKNEIIKEFSWSSICKRASLIYEN
jgi:glycosyltransferase involved in cell wall biosynthesis